MFITGPDRAPFHRAQGTLVLPLQHPVVHKALICLESAWETIQNGDHGSHAYTKALLAYVFALAGNKDKKNEILKSLDKEAVKEGENVCVSTG
jgi:alpha-2-macroglobulin